MMIGGLQIGSREQDIDRRVSEICRMFVAGTATACDHTKLQELIRERANRMMPPSIRRRPLRDAA